MRYEHDMMITHVAYIIRFVKIILGLHCIICQLVLYDENLHIRKSQGKGLDASTYMWRECRR